MDQRRGRVLRRHILREPDVSCLGCSASHSRTLEEQPPGNVPPPTPASVAAEQRACWRRSPPKARLFAAHVLHPQPNILQKQNQLPPDNIILQPAVLHHLSPRALSSRVAGALPEIVNWNIRPVHDLRILAFPPYVSSRLLAGQQQSSTQEHRTRGGWLVGQHPSGPHLAYQAPRHIISGLSHAPVHCQPVHVSCVVEFASSLCLPCTLIAPGSWSCKISPGHRVPTAPSRAPRPQSRPLI